ncbi:hypothetical protein ETB97_012265, partial [Aspergillus alliaceus]
MRDHYRVVEAASGTFGDIWSRAFGENGTVYIKIDDDVVFLDEMAIPRIVQTKIRRPDALLVSANVVNNPALGWLHYHIGAVRPYLPDISQNHGSELSTIENGKW